MKSVCVFRALVLGDLLCATPALRALRAALPGAHIALVGLPAMRELSVRLASVDEFIEFPGWPGLPERAVESTDAPSRFIAEMRERRHDLAIQLHGSGSIVNPLVHAFGARHTAGFCSPGAWTPAVDVARYLRWPEQGSEVERLLALTDHLGCPRQGLHLDFPLLPQDHDDAARLLHDVVCDGQCEGRFDGSRVEVPDPQRCCIVHPGSQLPSRRWPPQRFAAVADALAERGLTVLLTGSAAEAPLTAAVARSMRYPALDLAGRTSLWTLGALVDAAAVVIGNDTGISHVAAARRTPSVVVANGSDVLRWRPHDRARHAVLWHDLPCRPCSHVRCPTDHACALAITAEPVRSAALAAASSRFGSAADPRPAAMDRARV